MEQKFDDMRTKDSLNPVPYQGIKKGFLYGWVITLALGALNYGYSVGSFSQDVLTFSCLYYSEQGSQITQLNKNGLTLKQGFAGSLVQIGGTLGSIIAGGFTKYGKKRCIHLANLLTVIGCLIIISSGPYGLTIDYPIDGGQYLPMLLIGRFIYGLGSGFFTAFVSSFINEVSPNELTGPMGIAFQFFACLGVFLANLIGMPMIKTIKQLDENNPTCLNYPLQFESPEEEFANGINKFMRFDYWRIVFGIPILFSVLQFILMTTVYNYESPKYLKQNGMNAQLIEVFSKIYSRDHIKARIEAINVSKGGDIVITLRETFFDPRYRRATFIGVALSALYRLSGFNLLIFYGGNIFSNIVPDMGNFIQPLIGFMNFAPLIPAYFLISRYGRKQILTVCSFLMTITMIGSGVSIIFQPKQANDPDGYRTLGIIALVFINLYIVIFELSFGPLCWIFQAEIMTDKGLSIAVAVNLFFTVAAALLTPILFERFNGWVFVVCSGFCLLCAIFCLIYIKETKGLSRKQIAQLYSSVPIDVHILETELIKN